MNFSTTNVRIESDVLKELKHKAVEQGRRVAELIREALREYLSKNKEKTVSRKRGKDPIFSIIGMCNTGHKNDSEELDHLLYGKKK